MIQLWSTTVELRDEIRGRAAAGRGNRKGREPIGLSASELVSRLCDLERIKAERADQRIQKGGKGGAAG
jgi:hypothetical protein